MYRRLVNFYNRHPIVANSISGFAIFTTGDVISQLIPGIVEYVHAPKPHAGTARLRRGSSSSNSSDGEVSLASTIMHAAQRIDLSRSLSFGFLGMFMNGIVLSLWYRTLERFVGHSMTCKRTIAKKVALDQLVYAPFSITVYFGYTAFFEEFRAAPLYPATIATSVVPIAHILPADPATAVVFSGHQQPVEQQPLWPPSAGANASVVPVPTTNCSSSATGTIAATSAVPMPMSLPWEDMFGGMAAPADHPEPSADEDGHSHSHSHSHTPADPTYSKCYSAAEATASKLRNFLVQAWLADCCIWPATNFVSFRFVPLNFRPTFVGFVQVFWQSYLSFTSHKATICSDVTDHGNSSSNCRSNSGGGFSTINTEEQQRQLEEQGEVYVRQLSAHEQDGVAAAVEVVPPLQQQQQLQRQQVSSNHSSSSSSSSSSVLHREPARPKAKEAGAVATLSNGATSGGSSSSSTSIVQMEK